MDTKIIGGKIGRLPIYGAVTDLKTEEFEKVFHATGSLIKKLAIAGGIALGLALLLNRESDNSGVVVDKPDPSIPFSSSMVSYHGPRRNFHGFVLNEDIKFTCEGDEIVVPINLLKSFYFNSKMGLYSLEGPPGVIRIEMIDGGTYELPRPEFYEEKSQKDNLTKLKFITMAGLQTISFDNIKAISDDGLTCYQDHFELKIFAMQRRDVIKFRQNLKKALSYNLNNIIQALGKEIFEKYFNIEQFK